MLYPVANAPGRRSDRRERCRGDSGPFEIPPRPPGPVLLQGTPGRVHTRYRDLRTWQRTPCPAWRSRMEPRVAVARLRQAARDERARIARAAWEDTRTAPAYPPGSVSPGRR